MRAEVRQLIVSVIEGFYNANPPALGLGLMRLMEIEDWVMGA